MRIGNTIYLDHQATTPVDSSVFTKMLPYFHEQFGNPHSVDHSLGWSAARACDDAAAQVAALCGAEPSEVIFTSGATESNNWALTGLSSSPSDRAAFFIGSIDHKSSLATGRYLASRGHEVVSLAASSEGLYDIPAVRAAIAESTSPVVSICGVNSEIGTIQDIRSIADAVHSRGGILHVDAAQAPLAVTLGEWAREADLISLSAHKIYGPKGIGALIVRNQWKRRLAPLLHGGGQQGGLRSGTLPVALCVGFGEAAKLVLADGDEARRRLADMRDEFHRQLQAAIATPIILNGPALAYRHPGNLNLQFVGFDGRDVLASLQPRLAASTGSACTSGIEEPSHVLTGIGLSKSEAEASLRFCVGRLTAPQDIAESVSLIAGALRRLEAADIRVIENA